MVLSVKGRAINTFVEVDNSVVDDLIFTLDEEFGTSKMENNSMNNESICPECGSILEHEGGCNICRNCRFSKCG